MTDIGRLVVPTIRLAVHLALVPHKVILAEERLVTVLVLTRERSVSGGHVMTGSTPDRQIDGQIDR